jgi:hypothetical protein
MLESFGKNAKNSREFGVPVDQVVAGPTSVDLPLNAALGFPRVLSFLDRGREEVLQSTRKSNRQGNYTRPASYRVKNNRSSVSNVVPSRSAADFELFP